MEIKNYNEIKQMLQIAVENTELKVNLLNDIRKKSIFLNKEDLKKLNQGRQSSK